MNAPETLHLDKTEADISRAGAILRSGGLVAIPTETVYGLAADATDATAVAKIYAAKDRPQFNPLIAHCADLAMAQEIGTFDAESLRLASAFWPGPLTLVVPVRSGRVASLVTSGLPNIALRVPAHAIAQKVIVAAGVPLAAPSANPSGQISPTTAQHVLAGLTGRIDAVVNAGPGTVGLESTIIGGGRLLRPGGLPVEEIEALLGHSLDQTALDQAALDDIRPQSPGQLASHYAPRAALRLNARDARVGEQLLGFGGTRGATLDLSLTGDLAEAAANLFDHLHKLDEGEGDIAVAPVPQTGLGRAINDRLQRAAAPRT